MSKKNRKNKHQNSNKPNVTPEAFAQMPLNTFFTNYVMHHRESHVLGPSYDAFSDHVMRYMLPVIGELALRDLKADNLRGCYAYIHEWFHVPVKLMIGMNRLLEVALDSVLHRGMLKHNAAADLARAHIAETDRKLPYELYPIIVRQMRIDELDYLCDKKVPHYDIYAPYFNIRYLGTDMTDGINLVRCFLIDELEVAPRSGIDITLKGYSRAPGAKVILMKLDT